MIRKVSDRQTPGMTLSDRLGCAVLSGLFGALYAGLMILATVQLGFPLEYMTTLKWTTGGFALLGFVMGPFVGDVCGAILYFFWGLFEGLDPDGRTRPPYSAGRFLLGVFGIGCVTGLVLFMAG